MAAVMTSELRVSTEPVLSPLLPESSPKGLGAKLAPLSSTAYVLGLLPFAGPA